MEVNCEGCAGCCIDWRPIGPDEVDHERSSPRPPLDDTYNLVPLRRDEVRAWVDAGWGDALTPRLFEAAAGDASVHVGGHDVAAVGGDPVFYVGLRKTPKPVAPFGVDPVWLDACAFLDPETLQCRIHGDDRYPETCATYPGENLVLDTETECERVEAEYGGDRLVDDAPPEGVTPLFGPTAVGTELFVYPHPEELDAVVPRIAAGDATKEDRARFVGAAAGASPGTTAVNEDAAERAREQVLAADSWPGRVVEAWTDRAGTVGDDAPDPADLARDVEADAPETPGWD